MEIYKKVAMDNVGVIVFSYSDLDKYGKKWKLKKDDFPILIATVPKQKELKKLKFTPETLTSEMVSEFMYEVLNSAIVKLDPSKGKVKTLTSSNVN
jgi:hypothetical protein